MAGAATPNASRGAVTAQVIVFCVVWKSAAMRGMATARIVIVTLTENSPPRTVHRTHHSDRLLRSTRLVIRRRSRSGHGATATSSLPAPP